MSEHKTEPMPRWWWLNPWTFAIGQWEARDRHYAKYLEFSKSYGQANVELFNLKKEMQSQPKKEWQPIETAPKDGTIILLSFYYLNGVHTNKSFVAMTEWEKEINGYKILSNLEKDGTLKISHWMPIPESPKPPTN